MEMARYTAPLTVRHRHHVMRMEELPPKYTFGYGYLASHLCSSFRHIPEELVWLSLCVRAQSGDTDFVMACNEQFRV